MKKIVWLLREKENNRDEYSPAINWLYGILEELGYEVVYENFPSYGYSKDSFNIEDIEIFNKKAVYLYLRELTGLNTKQVVNNLNKLREKYSTFKNKWERE